MKDSNGASATPVATENQTASCKISKPSNETKKLFDFQKGHPNYVPLSEMQQVMGRMCSSLREEPDEGANSLLERSLNYLGSDRGQLPFLQELQAFLDRRTAHDILRSDETAIQSPPRSDSDSVLFITNGVSHGLDLLCATHTREGDTVLVERPTYFLASGIFKSHRLNVEGLPMTNDYQIDVVKLEQLLHDRHQETTISKIRMLYIIPIHQNPTGRCMHLAIKEKLADLSRRFGVLVVADEVYHLLDWRNRHSGDRVVNDVAEHERSARMVCFNPVPSTSDTGPSFPSQCISVSSFTKIFAPGVRCGWIEGPQSVISRLVQHGYIRSGGACQPVIGALLYEALRSGVIDRTLDKLIDSYARKCRLLCEVLLTEPRIRFYEPQGGYFIWIELPVCSEDFLQYCLDPSRDVQVKFLPGHRCDVGADLNYVRPALDRSARLCFAYLEAEELVTGAGHLISLLQTFLETM